jgi:hypothetical protein
MPHAEGEGRRRRRLGRRGTAVFVEYFVLALIVLLATVAFYTDRFGDMRLAVEEAFDSMVNEVLAP